MRIIPRDSIALFVVCGVACLLAATACQSTSSFHPQPRGWTALEWRACPEGVVGRERATCAFAEVPLDWDAPESRSLAVFARRISPDTPPAGQLWALDGGPGDAGDSFFQSWFADVVVAAGFELIIPSHRGGTYSTPLQCSGATDYPTCIDSLVQQWGAVGLGQFGPHQAARDVAAFAAAYRPPAGGPALLFGGSYGTIWAQRVVDSAPELWGGVALDAAVDVLANFEDSSAWGQIVGRRLLDRCEARPDCASHFSQPMDEVLQAVWNDAQSASGCIARLGISWDEVQRTFYILLEKTAERALVAPLLARLLRCAPEDEPVLQRALLRTGWEPLPSPKPSFNPLLNAAVALHSLVRPTQSLPELEAAVAAQLFNSGSSTTFFTWLQAFPAGFASPENAPTATYTGPLHIVHGGLDPRAPIELAQAIVDRWSDAAVDLLVVPEGGHFSRNHTRLPDGGTCTMEWIAAFLADPAAPLDRGCLDAVKPLDLEASSDTTRALSETLFGTSSPWGDSAVGR